MESQSKCLSNFCSHLRNSGRFQLLSGWPPVLPNFMDRGYLEGEITVGRDKRQCTYCPWWVTQSLKWLVLCFELREGFKKKYGIFHTSECGIYLWSLHRKGYWIQGVKKAIFISFLNRYCTHFLPFTMHKKLALINP